jgi:hypothetical protein
MNTANLRILGAQPSIQVLLMQHTEVSKARKFCSAYSPDNLNPSCTVASKNIPSNTCHQNNIILGLFISLTIQEQNREEVEWKWTPLCPHTHHLPQKNCRIVSLLGANF